MKIQKILLVTVLLIFVNIVYAEQFSANSSYDICFTPQNNCTNKIVSTIKNAKKQILIQAYSFTSKPIANALIKAKQKGIDIKIIFDKEQYKENHWLIASLEKQNIPIFIDNAIKGLAHNKVMIIDDEKVITGSFNFTNAAQKHNAKNVIILNDAAIAKKYKENWLTRF